MLETTKLICLFVCSPALLILVLALPVLLLAVLLFLGLLICAHIHACLIVRQIDWKVVVLCGGLSVAVAAVWGLSKGVLLACPPFLGYCLPTCQPAAPSLRVCRCLPPDT